MMIRITHYDQMAKIPRDIYYLINMIISTTTYIVRPSS